MTSVMLCTLAQLGLNVEELAPNTVVTILTGYGSPPQPKDITTRVKSVKGGRVVTAKKVTLTSMDCAGVIPRGRRFRNLAQQRKATGKLGDTQKSYGFRLL